MTGGDFALTAGWGHFGQGEAVMPGQGRVVERPLTASETAALGEAAPTLGDTTFDVYLNNRAYWRNVPAAVWHYKLGGYQVLKKWLSYVDDQDLYTIVITTYIPPRQVGDGPWTPWYADYYHPEV